MSEAHPSEHRGVDPGKLMERTHFIFFIIFHTINFVLHLYLGSFCFCSIFHQLIPFSYFVYNFREAVALASVRLSPFDEAFTNVYKAWASHLESEGNYGPAAKW